MMPVQVQVIGTAISTPIYPDVMQNPFNIGIGVTVKSTAAASVIAAVEHTFDYTTVMNPTFDGIRAWTVLPGGFSTVLATATWFQNSATQSAGVIGTTITTAGLNANYAFGVAAIRLNVQSTIAVLPVVAWFIQSVNAP